MGRPAVTEEQKAILALTRRLADSQERNSDLLGALRGLMSLTASAYGQQVNEVPEYQRAKAALAPSSMSVPKTAQEKYQ